MEKIVIAKYFPYGIDNIIYNYYIEYSIPTWQLIHNLKNKYKYQIRNTYLQKHIDSWYSSGLVAVFTKYPSDNNEMSDRLISTTLHSTYFDGYVLKYEIRDTIPYWQNNEFFSIIKCHKTKNKNKY